MDYVVQEVLGTYYLLEALSIKLTFKPMVSFIVATDSLE